VEKLMATLFSLTQQGRRHRDAVDVRGRLGAPNFGGGRQEVPERPDVWIGLARTDFAGPAHDHRHADSPLMKRALDAAQGARAAEERRIAAAFLVRAVVAR